MEDGEDTHGGVERCGVPHLATGFSLPRIASLRRSDDSGASSSDDGRGDNASPLLTPRTHLDSMSELTLLHPQEGLQPFLDHIDAASTVDEFDGLVDVFLSGLRKARLPPLTIPYPRPSRVSSEADLSLLLRLHATLCAALTAV